MYLKRIISENVGPIDKVDIKPSFNEDGSPKPLILVGKNGSGKSTILSNIVDSFYEIAGEAFDNARQRSDGIKSAYYKVISPSEIKIGNTFLVSYLDYDVPNTNYVFKSGNLNFNELKKILNVDNPPSFSWNDTGNVKQANISKIDAETAFNRDIICYFGPDRYEKPVWMGGAYFKNDESYHLSLKENWNGVLKNPITVRNVTDESLQWLLDLIADSRADIEPDGNQLKMLHQNVNDILLLLQSRKNVEAILGKILGRDIFFSLNIRNQGLSRFRIMDKSNGLNIVSPTLSSLSTGELALFNMFSTIARYGDMTNVNNSIYLKNIKGIVVIDEIELHLHSNLQKEVLPNLIKLFPQVQFVITTHSPLFLLGMRDTFGEDGFDIFEMPSGTKIDVERFSEFQKAYDYYQHTQKHQEELDAIVKQIKNNSSEKPLVITEGHTDWKHMKAALNALKEKEELKELFDNLDFEFFEYEPGNSSKEANKKTEMGSSILTMCKDFAKVNLRRKFIFIADRDCANVNKEFMDTNSSFKEWGNNVYSFIIPIPSMRTATSNICIEHLYTDDEIKTEIEINGIKRRLYMGYEFNKLGYSKSLKLMCEQRNACGEGKIDIIEGRENERVINLDDENSVNYSLTKTKFAEYILNKMPPFDKFDFSNFIGIFENIKEICNKEMV